MARSQLRPRMSKSISAPSKEGFTALTGVLTNSVRLIARVDREFSPRPEVTCGQAVVVVKPGGQALVLPLLI